MISPRAPRRAEGTHRCPVCRGTVEGAYIHPFCQHATTEDWAALRPYFTGTLEGVSPSGT